MATLGSNPINETMTAQDVFDIAAEHLLTQGVRSVDTSETNSDGSHPCAYDGGEVCCAAAPFIVDYHQDMEGTCYDDLTRFFGQPDYHVNLISCLQDAHDTVEPSEWRKALKDLAEEHKLNHDAI